MGTGKSKRAARETGATELEALQVLVRLRRPDLTKQEITQFSHAELLDKLDPVSDPLAVIAEGRKFKKSARLSLNPRSGQSGPRIKP